MAAREPVAARSIARPPRADSSVPVPQPLYVHLLDEDDDLAASLEVQARVAARALATARVLEAPAGACDLSAWFDAVGGGFGLLILDGVIAVETSVAERSAARLKGAGDLLQPPRRSLDELLEHALAWRAL